MRLAILSFLMTVVIYSTIHASNGVQIVNADATGFYVRCTFDSYTLQPVTINGQVYNNIVSNSTTPTLHKGYPEIIKWVLAVALPTSQPLKVEVVSSVSSITSGIDIAPSKGSVKQPLSPNEATYTFADVYKRNEYYPSASTSLQEAYSIADQEGQNIEVYPVQYNPTTHSVTIYKEIILHVTYTQPWQATNENVHVNSTFEAIKQNHFINYLSVSPYISKYPVHEEGDMLIITPDSFVTALKPFIQWKRRRGIHVFTAYIDSIGNTATAVRKYVKQFYAAHNISYLLLAGDAAQVPSDIARLSDGSNGNSDNLYGCVSGSDYYPDIIVGRFSAESITQLQTQIERSINYEKYMSAGNSWLGYGLCIASNFGTGDNNEYDWQHERLIRKELLNYTYSHIQELYDGTHKKDIIDTLYTDQPGDPNTVNFQKTVNNGVGVINYTGHGDYSGITTCNVNSTDVASLTNNNKLPFCWIVGCQVGNFVNKTCFAETGMRSTNSGKPSGWLGMLGSTVNQWWSEPMRAQDEFDTLLCQLKTYTRFTFGAISLSGELAMNDKYTYTGYDMTQTWVYFGDPSLLVRTKSLSNMDVQHDKVRSIGTDSLTVLCDINGAHATLVQHDSLIGSGIVSGGKIWFHFDPIISGDTIYVTITALNHVTYNGAVKILNPTGPYIAVIAHSLSDTGGNNNHRADFNEHIDVNISLKNIGVQTSTNIHLSVSSTDAYIKNIKILKGNAGVLYPNDILYFNGAFAFDVADSLPDGHNATFIISITDSIGNTYLSYIHENLLAPVLSIIDHAVEDTTGANKWWLNPGQSGNINVLVTNTGHSKADIKVNNATCSNLRVLAYPVSNTIPLLPDDTVWIKTPLHVSNTLSNNTLVYFNVGVADSLYKAQTSWRYILGRAVERFETGDFSLFNWIRSGDSLWYVTNAEHYEGRHSARSGHIGNYQSSSLSIAVNCTQDDTLFFAYKVSSEHKYDSLMFLLDSVLKLHWSGEKGWDIASLPILKGLHTFQWTYAKDPYNSVGQDCGYIDNIIFPAFASISSGDVYLGTQKLKVRIYPNPASNKVNIVFDDKVVSPLRINVWDMEGRVVYTSVSYSNYATWDVTTTAPGTYIIQCATNAVSHFEKVVVGR